MSNPFQPISFTNQGISEVTAEGDFVRTPLKATWPPRCVVCNADVPAADFNAKLVWYPRWVIFVFLLSRLIGLVLFFIKRKQLNLHVGLCEEHKSMRRQGMIGGVLAIVFGVLFFVGMVFMREAVAIFMMLGGGFACLIAGVLLLRRAAILVPKGVEGEEALVKVGLPFLESLRF